MSKKTNVKGKPAHMTIDLVTPPLALQKIQLGSSASIINNSIDVERTGAFNIGKLETLGLVASKKLEGRSIYSAVSNMSEVTTSGSLGIKVGAKASFDFVTVEGSYLSQSSWSSISNFTTQKINMSYLIKAQTYFLYGDTKIIQALTEDALALYNKVVSATTIQEKAINYLAFMQRYGQACVMHLDLVAGSIAQIYFKNTKSASKSSSLQEVTFAATVPQKGSISTSVNSASEEGNRLAALNIDYDIIDFPSDSPTKEWVHKLSTTALAAMTKKEWDKVEAPSVSPKEPVLPEYPTVPKKEIEDDNNKHWSNLESQYDAFFEKKDFIKALGVVKVQKSLAESTKIAASIKDVNKNKDNCKTGVTKRLDAQFDKEVSFDKIKSGTSPYKKEYSFILECLSPIAFDIYEGDEKTTLIGLTSRRNEVFQKLCYQTILSQLYHAKTQKTKFNEVQKANFVDFINYMVKDFNPAIPEAQLTIALELKVWLQGDDHQVSSSKQSIVKQRETASSFVPDVATAVIRGLMHLDGYPGTDVKAYLEDLQKEKDSYYTLAILRDALKLESSKITAFPKSTNGSKDDARDPVKPEKGTHGTYYVYNYETRPWSKILPGFNDLDFSNSIQSIYISKIIVYMLTRFQFGQYLTTFVSYDDNYKDVAEEYNIQCQELSKDIGRWMNIIFRNNNKEFIDAKSFYENKVKEFYNDLKGARKLWDGFDTTYKAFYTFYKYFREARWGYYVDNFKDDTTSYVRAIYSLKHDNTYQSKFDNLAYCNMLRKSSSGEDAYQVRLYPMIDPNSTQDNKLVVNLIQYQSGVDNSGGKIEWVSKWLPITTLITPLTEKEKETYEVYRFKLNQLEGITLSTEMKNEDFDVPTRIPIKDKIAKNTYVVSRKTTRKRELEALNFTYSCELKRVKEVNNPILGAPLIQVGMEWIPRKKDA